MDTRTFTREEYAPYDYPSRGIAGTPRPRYSRGASRLTEIDMRIICREIREAIRKDPRGDEDGRIYTVAYKVYDIRARHICQPQYEQRYDLYFGDYETVQTGCIDEIEAIEVRDIDGGNHPGQCIRLNHYMRLHNA